jgi:hypothetical protein
VISDWFLGYFHRIKEDYGPNINGIKLLHHCLAGDMALKTEHCEEPREIFKC